MGKAKPFTEDEKEFIVNNKEKMFFNQIAVILNRSQPAIRRFCQKIEREESKED